MPVSDFCPNAWNVLLPDTKGRNGARVRRYHFVHVRALVVEDDESPPKLTSALQAEHHDVVVAPTGDDGFFRAHADAFDLVVLDLTPGRSGLDILQTLRRHIEMTRLRKKVDADAGDRLIHTVRGVGFILREGEP